MAGMPFDATFKDLIEENGRAWAERLITGPILDVSVVDGDVATVSASADKVLRVKQPNGDCLLNIEFESSHAAEAPDQMLRYSVLLRHHHKLPVRSVVLLLRKEANATNLTETLEVRVAPTEVPYLTFRYQVVPLWKEPLAPLLSGSLAMLPLALITDEAEADLPGVVQQVVTRLRAETTREQAAKMETVAVLLMGLRYKEALVVQLFQGVQEMEDSTTYQGILRRGEARGEERGLRETIRRLGRQKFGEPDEEAILLLEGTTDLNRLRELIDRILGAKSWSELFS